MPLGTFNGLPLGGGAPPKQALTCSLGSGYLYLQVGYAQSAAVAYDASPGELALALENLGVVASVGVVALPRLVGGLHLTPRAICSGGEGGGGGGGGGAPVVTHITFWGWGGALPAVTLRAAEQSGSEAGSASVAVLAAGSLPSYGSAGAGGAGAPGARSTWDAGMLHGCHCDGYPDWNASGVDFGGGVDRGRWGGSACALRACPVGAVALAPGGVAREAQSLACAGATGGTFTLAFRGLVSAPINHDAAAWEVAAALQALPSVGLVRVSARGDARAGVCGGGPASAPGNTFEVAFQTLLGALPLLVADGALLQGPAGGVALSVARETAGAGLLKECSGHGVCDTSAGLCACLPGYASSNGALAAGSRGDCGISRGAGGV